MQTLMISHFYDVGWRRGKGCQWQKNAADNTSSFFDYSCKQGSEFIAVSLVVGR
jgi:hypothetical protein